MKAATPLPSADELHRLFSYNSDTGQLTYKVMGYNKGYLIGAEVPIGSNGYRRTRIQSREFMAHRIIYKMMTGDDPTNEVDHKDGDKQNNKWDNLRSATRAQNKQNCPTPSRNTSGFRGVSYNRKAGLWQSTIGVEGRYIYVGQFKTMQEASDAYQAAAKQYHGEFIRPESDGKL